ncbi:DUF3291 domain-containing protein [Catellatospora coxensis]|uniref:DUF3291 domain-containing protein n=1 Tax=Catellatospora coxensis TaxID=310354 RepID=A0A8J3LER4_9ACTN|nr:DUF3291 domain-containing protein [Catellatospora coxensis]GIG11370.1 hypothetical protein Cco03nite_80700 [Catellatospora coxensis]
MYIAQFNISKERYPLEHPAMQDFVDRLGEVNAVADEWEGFVWRLHDDTGNATAIRTFDDPTIIFNLSVWKSVATLKDFVYQSRHVEVLKKRRTWFEHWDKPSYVLWWVEESARPSLEEAKARLRHIQDNGPSAHAFDFDHVPDTASIDG